ncbi:MAG: hypothetical protein J3K34DRAFT_425315, partial [Monoraphidium minutum]
MRKRAAARGVASRAAAFVWSRLLCGFNFEVCVPFRLPLNKSAPGGTTTSTGAAAFSLDSRTRTCPRARRTTSVI